MNEWFYIVRFKNSAMDHLNVKLQKDFFSSLKTTETTLGFRAMFLCMAFGIYFKIRF
jgi:hypothetical protein